MIPAKLRAGDEIRIIAPSRSMKIIKQDIIDLAVQRLESLGLKVTFGEHVNDSWDEDYLCASIEDRVKDLEAAFADKNVKAILTVIGGFNVNQILDYINYDIIKKNPKILCGFSDITALSNSIYAKTGLVTYSGVHFSSFGMKIGFEYSMQYFKTMFMQENAFEVKASEKWRDDSWFKNQDDAKLNENEGYLVINEGQAEGTIIGGNLCTLNLLQGTEYMPKDDNIILFLEDDDLVGKTFLKEFDRDLQSLLHALKGKKIQGILLGRAQKASDMTNEKWIKLIKSKKELVNVPVVANLDFGHTTPIFTYPIGGKAKFTAKNGKTNIFIKG